MHPAHPPGYGPDTANFKSYNVADVQFFLSLGPCERHGITKMAAPGHKSRLACQILIDIYDHLIIQGHEAHCLSKRSL